MFVRAANPIWYFPDLTGLPLNDEYYIFFLTNTLPYQPQNVYQDPQGMVVWNNPIEFYPNGTLPDNIYFDPDLVYRIEIRHGNTQGDQLIYEIDNFSPGETGTPSGNSLAIFGSENQISNSQFSEISFVSPLTITTAGTYNIAPGWDLILTGVGTVSTIITQFTQSGDQFPDNPPPPFPYGLRFQNTGWSSAILQQTFDNNGAIFSLGAITGSIEGRALISNQAISMNYVPSDSSTSPGQPTAIFSGTLLLGDYQTIAGAVNVNFTGNTDVGTNAYVNIQIILPPQGSLELSNIQLIGQTDALPVPISPTFIPSYKQETDDRMVDHLFHYYRDNLLIKPKKSLLTAWNFPQNPYQFISPTLATVPNQCQYIADQTILYQNAASQVQSGQNDVANRLNLLIKAVTSSTDNRFALIQYIDPSTVAPYWSYILSAFARARIFTTHGTSVRLKCRLIYRTTLPSAIGNTEPISTWLPNEDPVFAAGWTALKPLNDPAYVLPNAYSTDETTGANSYPGFSFDQFQLPNASTPTMTLGIVIYTMDQMNATSTTEDSIAFDKISLIPSLFGSDGAAQTFDEVWRECQYYYEQSYASNVLAGTATDVGLCYFNNPLSAQSGQILCKSSFNLIYKQIKRSFPTVVFYAPDGTINSIRLSVWNGTNYTAPNTPVYSNPKNISSGEWSSITFTTYNMYMRPNNSSTSIALSGSSLSDQGELVFQYTADSRLGI